MNFVFEVDMGVGGGGGGGGGGPLREPKLEIEFKNPEIQIVSDSGCSFPKWL